MSTRTYTVWTDDFCLSVEVDRDLMTDERLHEINRFWGNADDLLAEADGDVFRAVLGRLFREVRAINLEHRGLHLEGVLHEFAWRDRRGEPKSGVEGWPPLDGSEGLRLVECDAEVDLDDEPLISEEV